MLSTPTTMFQDLATLFDVLITFEFGPNLIGIFNEHSQGLSDKSKQEIIYPKQIDFDKLGFECPTLLVQPGLDL